MGLWDDFGIDIDDVKEASGFSGPDDGTHEWVIAEARKQEGTPSHENYTYFIIDYDLDEAGNFREWFTIAVDGDSTHPKAKQSLGYLKARLVSLGVNPATFDDGEELEGIKGAFRLASKQGKGASKDKVFQNIVPSSFSVYGVGEDNSGEPSDYDDDTAAADVAAKARVKANQTARNTVPAKPAARKPAAKPAPADDEDDNPFDV